MRINAKNFFEHFIIHPFAVDLSSGEKIIAVAFSLLLFPITIATYLLDRKIVVKVNLKERQSHFRQLSASIQKVKLNALHPERQNIPVKQGDISQLISESFVKEFYAKKLPEKDAVTVPVLDLNTNTTTWKRWRSLSRAEKIRVNNTGTHAHNQISRWAPEMFVDLRFFTLHHNHQFIEGDPRKSHGNDHCVRTSIFAAVFAYLYQKYHPDHNVNSQDITVSQLVAAGHDLERQTEGPDVYDEKSAETTCTLLKKMGIVDPVILHDAHEAIAHKDSPPNKRKSLTAKCVQNADCAEFARLLLRSRTQDKKGFDDSRNYLDIYKELHEMAKQSNPENPGQALLKDGTTFEGFCYELDILRTEMNDFIYQTHNQDFRKKAVQSKNCYETFLNFIDPTEFPILHSVLQRIDVKTPIPDRQQIQEQRDVSDGKAWEQYGFSRIKSSSLQKLMNRLENSGSAKSRDLKQQIQIELNKRQNAENTYLEVINRYALSIQDLVHAYAHLPPLLKVEQYKTFIQKLSFLSSGSAAALVKEIIVNLDKSLQPIYYTALLQIRHEELKQQLTAIENTPSPSRGQLSELRRNAILITFDHNSSHPSLRDPGAQTTAALALQKAAHIYLSLGEQNLAQVTLKTASDTLYLDSTNPFNNLERICRNQGGQPIFLPSDCGFLRKRKMRVCEKLIQNHTGHTDKYYELSLELPAPIREQIEEVLKLIPQKQKEVVSAEFLKKEGQHYRSQESLKIGEDLKIALAPNVDIFLGNNKYYWNQYHLMRIRVKSGTPSQAIQAALSQIGLPMALMPSRDEDIANEMLARSLGFRFPQVLYGNMPHSKPALAAYGELTEAQKKIVDHDVENFKIAQVGTHHYEVVQPQIAQEAWKAGVRSVGAFIYGGYRMEDNAKILKNILSTGMLSTEERFQNGILGLGCVPEANYTQGSGNEVFARIFTKQLFEKNFSMNAFPVKGHILILMDPQALERMPYSYLYDRGGVRNPHYKCDIFRAQKQPVVFNFQGDKMMKERLGFKEHIEKLNQADFPVNETMFDLNLGARYIQKLVVWGEEERSALISALQKEGVHYLGNTPIEEAVVASQTLHPGLIDHFHEEQNPVYSERERQNGIDYI